MRNLLERLEKNVLVADGAMGTALYGNGLESCHEYNNISNPDSVEKIHRAYIEAGADIIQTNTYAAKKCQLKTYGYEDKFEEITDRTNRITALGSAMGAVDLSKTPAKKFRVGAGVGHSANNQAVAVGIGYAPTERLRLNTKISTTTNSTKSSRSNGISIGASYDLDW